MNSDSWIVTCGRCGTKNRVRKDCLNRHPVCGKCKARLIISDGPHRPLDVTDQTFAAEVLSHPGYILVDCWAPWCGPCNMVAPVLEELALEYAGRLKIAKLNVDDNPVIASQYGIQSIPTMLFFKNGEQVNRLVGALPRQEIERHLAGLL